MLVRLYLPVIILILLKNILVLAADADGIVSGFHEDYQRIVCARSDVYRRNLQDGLQYLMARYDYLEEADLDSLLPEPLACTDVDFAVYREVNAKLPFVYPNWLYKEMSNTKGGEYGKGGG